MSTSNKVTNDKMKKKDLNIKNEDADDSDEEKSDSEWTDSDADDDDDIDTGLTENQGRLLYMISLYTHAATTEEENEEWIRKPALAILIYEAIVNQVLDFDYAPASAIIEGGRKYLNISQEGNSDIDYLREEELINGLKLSSKDYQPVTCFQISEKGLEVLKKLKKKDKDTVHEFIYAPNTRELISAVFDGEFYWLTSASGYRKKSTVTNTEDVAYVSSAYVPQCLRHGGRPTLSNAHRAHESGLSANNIRDELDEVITLNSVSIIVSEYIPTGANQIVALNQNLGSTERVQGGFFTAVIDDSSSGTKFEVPPGLTSVNVLDYTLTDHINFEANIHFPETDGIVQVETFGCSLNADGTMFYGMQIEAIQDRIKDNLSLDHLSRLLVDVHIDSSEIVDSVISNYQRTLLELIYRGDAANRDKVNLIIANEITPHLTAEEYMDHGEYENELKQVLGDTRAAYDISEHDTLVFGEHGLLVAGPNSRHHEPLLTSYLQFQSMDLFVKNYFNRMFLVLDDMATVRNQIDNWNKDPNSLDYIRRDLAELSKHCILMEEILNYMKESLAVMVVPPEPPEQSGRSLYERLEIALLKGQLVIRVNDLFKNMGGAKNELSVLREMSTVLSENKMFSLQEGVNVNTRQLCSLSEANEKTSTTLEIMQVVLAGSLAFDILDRITGDWSVMNTEWMRDLAEPMIRNTPTLWFFINLVFWAILGTSLIFLMRVLGYRAAGLVTVKEKIYKKVNMEALLLFLHDQDLSQEDSDYIGENNLTKVSWTEKDKLKWGGSSPKVSIEYDPFTGFIHELAVVYSRRTAKNAFTAKELKQKFKKELAKVGVWLPGDDFLKGMDFGDEDDTAAQTKK